MLPKTLIHNVYVERGPSENVILKYIDSTQWVKKSGQMRKTQAFI
jgi:hypothetical protein